MRHACIARPKRNTARAILAAGGLAGLAMYFLLEEQLRTVAGRAHIVTMPLTRSWSTMSPARSASMALSSAARRSFFTVPKTCVQRIQCVFREVYMRFEECFRMSRKAVRGVFWGVPSV